MIDVGSSRPFATLTLPVAPKPPAVAAPVQPPKVQAPQPVVQKVVVAVGKLPIPAGAFAVCVVASFCKKTKDGEPHSLSGRTCDKIYNSLLVPKNMTF